MFDIFTTEGLISFLYSLPALLISLSVHEFLGDDAPAGWMKPDGRYLVKAYYPQLLATIEKYNLAISEEEYEQQIATNGYCNYFVVYDGLIRIPTIGSTIGGRTLMIKTHLTPNKTATDTSPNLDTVYVYRDDISMFGQGPFRFIETYNDALGNALDDLPQ